MFLKFFRWIKPRRRRTTKVF